MVAPGECRFNARNEHFPVVVAGHLSSGFETHHRVRQVSQLLKHRNPQGLASERIRFVGQRPSRLGIDDRYHPFLGVTLRVAFTLVHDI